jgi:hypothetical protein
MLEFDSTWDSVEKPDVEEVIRSEGPSLVNGLTHLHRSGLVIAGVGS